MSELLFELLLALAELFLEAFLELVASVVVDLVSRALAQVFETAEISNPLLATLGYTLLGAITGSLSILVLPHPLVHPSRIHGISLLVSPVLTGAAMSLIGSMLSRPDRRAAQIESFQYGFAFAFGMALVRFLFAR